MLMSSRGGPHLGGLYADEFSRRAPFFMVYHFHFEMLLVAAKLNLVLMMMMKNGLGSL